MGRRVLFTKGKNNAFFQATSVADQPEAPPKGNLLGAGDRRPRLPKPFGAGYTGKYNQGVTSPNEPPRPAQRGYFSKGRPYQANMGLTNGLQRRPNR